VAESEVHKIVQAMKKKLKAKIFADEKVKPTKLLKKNDPLVKDHILKYIELHSYSKMNLKALREFLLGELDPKRVPSLPTISKIIKEDFHLKHCTFQGSMHKYQDPTYNEKRLWISRLLAQFFKD
jgi:hypothetical protein